MKPKLKHYIYAKGWIWAIPFFGMPLWGAFLGGIALYNFHFILFILGTVIGSAIGLMFGIVIVGAGTVGSAKENGAPFKIGDEVQILTGRYKKCIGQVRDVQDSYRGKIVYVKFDDGAKESFSELEIFLIKRSDGTYHKTIAEVESDIQYENPETLLEYFEKLHEEYPGHQKYLIGVQFCKELTDYTNNKEAQQKDVDALFEKLESNLPPEGINGLHYKLQDLIWNVIVQIEQNGLKTDNWKNEFKKVRKLKILDAIVVIFIIIVTMIYCFYFKT